MKRHAAQGLVLLTLGELVGCPGTSVGDDEAGTTTMDEESGTSDSGTSDTSDDGTTGGLELDGVSILLIVDNSGSMGEEQSRLTTGIFALTDALDGAGIDWRIGVTTSDNGNPWCPVGSTTPEGGKLVLSSCKQRLADFLFSDTVDVQDLACNDICELDSIGVQPSSTRSEPTPKSHPWIERSAGVANVDAPIDEVLRCVIPQGVNGCGFESQLESAFLSVSRAASPGEADYGFFEPGRLPVLIFLSDEADCSYNKSWEQIFTGEGNKAFWSDPSAAFPTSAVCWNAGVDCVGSPESRACTSMNKGVMGWLNVSDTDAVLHPVDRYNGQFGGVGAIVFGILGVDESGEPRYADAEDPAFQDSFGIGPGCTAPGNVTAVPPVRMLEVAEANAPSGGRKLYSVCGANYGPTFADIGQTILSSF